MKERGQKILDKLRETDAKQFDSEWKSGKWSHLKSFVEIGIKPDTKILSLWENFGGKGEIYNKYLVKSGFEYEERQKFWGLMTIFQNDVGDLAKIEDFQDISVTDLEDLKSYSRTDIKILCRVFATSTK